MTTSRSLGTSDTRDSWRRRKETHTALAKKNKQGENVREIQFIFLSNAQREISLCEPLCVARCIQLASKWNAISFDTMNDLIKQFNYFFELMAKFSLLRERHLSHSKMAVHSCSSLCRWVCNSNAFQNVDFGFGSFPRIVCPVRLRRAVCPAGEHTGQIFSRN